MATLAIVASLINALSKALTEALPQALTSVQPKYFYSIKHGNDSNPRSYSLLRSPFEGSSFEEACIFLFPIEYDSPEYLLTDGNKVYVCSENCTVYVYDIATKGTSEILCPFEKPKYAKYEVINGLLCAKHGTHRDEAQYDGTNWVYGISKSFFIDNSHLAYSSVLVVPGHEKYTIRDNYLFKNGEMICDNPLDCFSRYRMITFNGPGEILGEKYVYVMIGRGKLLRKKESGPLHTLEEFKEVKYTFDPRDEKIVVDHDKIYVISSMFEINRMTRYYLVIVYSKLGEVSAFLQEHVHGTYCLPTIVCESL